MFTSIRFALLALACAAACSACSSADLYLYSQAMQYEKCDKLQDAESRRRCREATYPDKAKYDKDRQATQSGK